MDEERHPAEFLPFTQVKPGMQVLDVSAGGGYTSQLLALAVGPSGTVWAQAPKPGATLLKRLADHPQPNLIVIARPFDDPLPADVYKLDLITLILNYHDTVWMGADRAKMNRAVFAALKPGGVYGIIDHSAKDGAGTTVAHTLHRIDEATVKQEVTAAGFKLDGEADFLRNPADARDWNPSPRAAGARRGTSDRFVLRFVKP